MNAVFRRVTQAAFYCALLAGSNARAQTYTFGNASYPAPGFASISPPQRERTHAYSRLQR
jgi:hypothetical protein